MQTVSNILDEFLKDLNLNRGKTLQCIRNNWESIIGDGIAPHTYAASLKGQCIDVIVDSSVWLQNLTFLKGMILEKFREYKIQDIRYRVGKIPESEQSAAGHKKRKLSDEEQAFIQKSVLTIEDRELRKCLENLMITAMSTVRPEK